MSGMFACFASHVYLCQIQPFLYLLVYFKTIFQPLSIPSPYSQTKRNENLVCLLHMQKYFIYYGLKPIAESVRY